MEVLRDNSYPSSSSTDTQAIRQPNHPTKDQSDPSLHQWSIRNSQKGPQVTGHQGSFPPTQHSAPPTGLPQRTLHQWTKTPCLHQSVHWQSGRRPKHWLYEHAYFRTGMWPHLLCLSKDGPQATTWTYPKQTSLTTNLCDNTVTLRDLSLPTPPRHFELRNGD